MRFTVKVPCDVDIKFVTDRAYTVIYETITDEMPADGPIEFEGLDDETYNAILDEVIKELETYKRKKED